MLKITIITVGNKMPNWIVEGCHEYAKRLTENTQLKLIEIPMISRTKSTHIEKAMERESLLMKAAIPNNARLIGMVINGETFSSEGLAQKIEKIQQTHSHLCFLIGGPEGMAPELISACDEKWSLSKLTLPHPLARIVLIEALYRGISILKNHPYHK
jgi:23S rRNA (pseudouridine1915-N3)-methyltransferase